jgi:hypothetical protein
MTGKRHIWRPTEAQKERNRLIRQQRQNDRRAAKRCWLKSLQAPKPQETDK